MEHRKKLLYFVEAMGGGVFTYIVDLANELVNTYDMYIAYATRPQTPPDYKDFFDKRIHLIEVKNFKRSINLAREFLALREIKQIANDIDPDYIHLHSSKAGVLGRIAFGKSGAKLFYTPHGYSFLMEDHGKLKRNIYKTIERSCAKSKCITISCSLGEHNETIKLTNRAVYVNNGVNICSLNSILDSTSIRRNEHFTVFTLGRICPQKNPRLFNQIALALPDIKFIWIGDGELRYDLNAPNIEITGWCKHEDAIRISYSSDAFILTSLWEGLPISLLEAMYMRKYCIVSNVIGNKDVIHSKVNGFICDSVGDYVNAINEVMANDRSDILEKAYEEVINVYNTKIMAEQYIRIYETSE